MKPTEMRNNQKLKEFGFGVPLDYVGVNITNKYEEFPCENCKRKKMVRVGAHKYVCESCDKSLIL